MTKEELLTSITYLIETHLQRKEDIDWNALANCACLEIKIMEQKVKDGKSS